MAKKRGRRRGGPNKSRAVREYFESNPGAAPKEVVEALGAQGIKVSPQLVSNIKSRLKAGGGKPGRKPGRRASGQLVGGQSLGALLEAKRLVDSVGSVHAAREALEVLAKLRA